MQLYYEGYHPLLFFISLNSDVWITSPQVHRAYQVKQSKYNHSINVKYYSDRINNTKPDVR